MTTVKDVLPERSRSDDHMTRTPVKHDKVSQLLEYGIYLALLGLIVYFSLASEYFLDHRNILNIGNAVALTGILAAGLTVTMIAGQLDLSFGPLIGLTAVIIAKLSDAGVPLLVAIGVAVLVGLAAGAVNGLLTVTLGITSIIATLALGTFLTGSAYLLAQGQVISLAAAESLSWVNARPLGVPTPVYFLALVYVAAWVMLTRTRLGWHLYATGGNRSAALRAGINTNGIFRFVFLQNAGLAVLAGILVAGRTGAGDPSYGASEVFLVLTAVLLGGIGLAGGSGRVQRTLVGVLIIGVLANGLVLMNVQSYYQQLIQGGVLVLAVVLDAIRTKRMSR